MKMQETTHESFSKSVGASKIIRLVVSLIVILLTICLGIGVLYPYATYNSLCLDGAPNNIYAYILRSLNPDMEAAEAFIKDHLLSQLAQTALEPDYPFVTSQVQSWRSPYIDFIEQNFGRDLDGYLWEPRTAYAIHINSEDTQITISYHRPKTDEDQRAFLGASVYIVPFWPGVQPHPGDDPVIIVATRIDSGQSTTQRFYQTTLFVQKALDQIRKCGP